MIVLKDTKGKPRGIEKTWNDTIFHTQEDAEKQLARFKADVTFPYASSFTVVKAFVRYAGQLPTAEAGGLVGKANSPG